MLLEVYLILIGETSRDKMKEVPQLIERSGLSADYLNEFSAYVSTIEFIKTKSESADDVFRDLSECHQRNPIRRYEERFTSNKYSNVKNNMNLDGIKALDWIVGRFENVLIPLFNGNVKPENFDGLEIENLYQLARNVIE
jgi:hypothetical protein